MHGDTQAMEPSCKTTMGSRCTPDSSLTRLRGAGVVDDLLREENVGAVGRPRARRGGELRAVAHVLEQEDQPVHRPGDASAC